jgi:hypothetical protein
MIMTFEASIDSLRVTSSGYCEFTCICPTSTGNDCTRVATELAVLVNRASARVRALRERSHGFQKLLENQLTDYFEKIV